MRCRSPLFGVEYDNSNRVHDLQIVSKEEIANPYSIMYAPIVECFGGVYWHCVFAFDLRQGLWIKTRSVEWMDMGYGGGGGIWCNDGVELSSG